jgi:polysaccharide biosynthesis protein PslH
MTMRVLFLTHRLPYAPNRGDRIRAHYILRALRAHARVALVSLVHDGEEARHVDLIRDLVDEVHLAPVRRIRNGVAAAGALLTTKPLTHALLDSAAISGVLQTIMAARRPDVVLAYGSGMARFAVEPPLAEVPLVVDLVDVDSRKWKNLAVRTLAPMRWIYRREARWLSRFEAQLARSAFATTVVNRREQAALRAIAPDARVEVVQVGIDHEHLKPISGPADAPGVVFCGVMNYAPNVEAAVWLARDVWPLVRNRCVDARLMLVGSSPVAAVRRLASPERGIEVTGAVPDVRPFLWNAALATAPLQVAQGVQTKVLEAVGAGLPAIITSVVADGLPAEILRACRIADTPQAFGDAIVRTLECSPHARRAMTERVDFSQLSWARQLAPLISLLQAAAFGKASREGNAESLRSTGSRT